MSKRGRPRKYPRPQNCPHENRKEHKNGVCYQCSSNYNNQKKREKKAKHLLPPSASVMAPPTAVPSMIPMGGFVHPMSYTNANTMIAHHHNAGMQDTRLNADCSVALGGSSTGVIELNVGGKVFMTDCSTVKRILALTGFIQITPETIFFDRDPTHFRWILNYLRDQTLRSRPPDIFDRAELIIEANYYRLTDLVNILLEPAFLYERPSYKGIYILSTKWCEIAPDSLMLNWGHIAVQFHQNLPKVTFMSLKYDDPHSQSNKHTLTLYLEEIKTTDLVEVVSANTSLSFNNIQYYFEFRWTRQTTDYNTAPCLELQIKSQWQKKSEFKPMYFLLASNYTTNHQTL